MSDHGLWDHQDPPPFDPSTLDRDELLHLAWAEHRRAEAATAAVARVRALCEQAVAEYQPHDVTPWVAVHELRAALAEGSET